MVNSNSKKQYIQTYLSLVKKANSEKLDDIYNHIVNSRVKDTTKLNYLNSIISLKKIDPSLVKGDLTDVSELRDKLNIKLDKARSENNITAGQAPAMEKISIDDLHDFVDELDKKKDESLRALEDYILIAMMVNYPLRNDLQEVKLTNHKADLKTPLNAIFVPKSGNAILSLKEYKTAKTYGDLNIPMSDKISDAIRKLVKSDTFRKHLFVNKDNKPLTSSAFTHRLNKIFMDKFGVPASSTIIRKIYLSGKYKDVVEEMEKDAKMMGHSISTQQKVYVSNNDKTKKKGKAKTLDET